MRNSPREHTGTFRSKSLARCIETNYLYFLFRISYMKFIWFLKFIVIFRQLKSNQTVGKVIFSLFPYKFLHYLQFTAWKGETFKSFKSFGSLNWEMTWNFLIFIYLFWFWFWFFKDKSLSDECVWQRQSCYYLTGVSVKDSMGCQNESKQILGAEKEKYWYSLDTQESFISFDTLLLY